MCVEVVEFVCVCVCVRERESLCVHYFDHSYNYVPTCMSFQEVEKIKQMLPGEGALDESKGRICPENTISSSITVH